MKPWPKINLQTADGETVSAQAPIIISASRATDIPAFYAKWLINRFEKGYVKWINPFNQEPVYVSFQNARLFVFWTKNPKPLMPLLETFDKAKVNYYFQFTLNDYVAEDFEPHLPPLQSRIETFKALSKKIGRARVVWRFDPIIFNDQLDAAALTEKIKHLAKKLHNYTEKLVISFADIDEYAKVRRNLARAKLRYRRPSDEEIRDLAGRIAEIAAPWKMTVATCAEKIDLSPFNIVHNKCIDDELIIRLFRHDRELMAFLGVNDQPSLFETPRPSLKDPGQRAACGCIMSKDIGQYNTCPHLCVYCYANSSPTAVRSNHRRHRSDGESIV